MRALPSASLDSSKRLLLTSPTGKHPYTQPDSTLEERTKGTPQGGVVSPLLANLFLHYVFDHWMRRIFPNGQFERYADDAIVHCKSEDQAREVLEAIRAGSSSAVWSFTLV
jgi:retron-type reverse transcriptase